jgi:hypothetical protein
MVSSVALAEEDRLALSSELRMASQFRLFTYSTPDYT